MFITHIVIDIVIATIELVCLVFSQSELDFTLSRPVSSELHSDFHIETGSLLVLIQESADGCSEEPFLCLSAYRFCLLHVVAIHLINRLPFIIVMIQSHIINALNFTYKREPGKTQSDNPPGQDLKLLLSVKSIRGATVLFGFQFRFGTARVFGF